MKSKNTFELPLLKTILWVYIIMCVIIAGLNYGYASKAPASVSALIRWIWEFYENWIKTLFIFIGSILTLRIIGSSQRTTLRKMNLMGFIIAALVVHIVAPLLLHNGELYFFVNAFTLDNYAFTTPQFRILFLLKPFPRVGFIGYYLCFDFLCVYQRLGHCGNPSLW